MKTSRACARRFPNSIKNTECNASFENSITAEMDVILLTDVLQLLGMILELYESVDEVFSPHVVLLPVIYGLAGNVYHEIVDIVIVDPVADMLEEPRYIPEYVPDEHFQVGAEDPVAYPAEFIVLLFHGVHFKAEGARADHVDGELSRESTALDDGLLRRYLS